MTRSDQNADQASDDRFPAGPESTVGRRATPSRDDPFTTTRWSIVAAAADPSHEQAHDALTELCETYWQPLYAFARRRFEDTHESRDLTQSFFAELIQKNYVRDADPDRGRFRAFLLASFKNFISKEWEKSRAEKRGGKHQHLSLDFDAADSGPLSLQARDSLTPEQSYDRQWAIAMLSRVLERLREEMASGGKTDTFEAMKEFLTGDGRGRRYDQVAEELDITPTAAKMAVHRMRRRYAELIREEVASTLEDPGETDDEINKLFEAMTL